jgi:four helix bundle protein
VVGGWRLAVGCWRLAIKTLKLWNRVMALKSYRDLRVWQLAIELVKEVYQVTRSFPREEKFGLTSQIQRAAVSIPSNIAEGHARESENDFHRFLSIAQGSLCELETQLIIGRQLNYLDGECLNETMARTDLIGKMIRQLRKRIRSENASR